MIEAAWNWINMTIPVISSTFASFSRMCKNLGAETLGHLFIDEAGQALPQAAVGAIYRSRHVMVVGDPLQIKPVLTLDSNTLYMLGEHFGVTEKYLSASASAQILADAASQYGFYRKQDKAEDSWVGIPLWVHRRCRYPMFTISNMISYDGFMVQGMEKYGKTDWFDVGGTANNKYVEEQGEFLLHKLKEMIDKNPKILDKKEKDVVYVITPFSNVAYQLSQKLRKIHFTRYDEQGKPTNVGTVHTFQGKEAPIVFFVLGADRQSSGAARWAVTEANIMNVAATRAKEEFYIISDRKLYLGLGCDVATDTDRIIREYKNQYLVDDHAHKNELRMQDDETRTLIIDADFRRITGTVKYVGKGTESFYAYVVGADGKEYSITESIYSKTESAIEVLVTVVPVQNKDFEWSTTGTFSLNSNKLISLSGSIFKSDYDYFNTGTVEYSGQVADSHRVQVGESIGNFYGFKVVDVDSEGRWIYEDRNGELVNYKDFTHAPEDKHVIGNGLPKWYAGWNNTLRYKNFDLNVTMRGAFGFQIINGGRMNYENVKNSRFENRLKSVNDLVFGKHTLSPEVEPEFNSYYVEDDDYWKIDNITLGYSFGQVGKYIKSLRIYGSVLNALTITGYKGIDPEVSTDGLTPGYDTRDRYPSVRSFTFGVNVKF